MSNHLDGLIGRAEPGLDSLCNKEVSSREIQAAGQLTHRVTIKILKGLLGLPDQHITRKDKKFIIVRENPYITVKGHQGPLRCYEMSLEGIEKFKQEIDLILAKKKSPKLPKVSLK